MSVIYKFEVKKGEALEVLETETKVSSAKDVYKFACFMEWNEHEQEHLFAIHLDAKNKIKGYTLVTMGLIDRSHIHAREVFRSAIINGASRIILVHNHPSGDPTPSSQDISSTREMRCAGKIIGIQITDHIILGEIDYYSLLDNGFIKD